MNWKKILKGLGEGAKIALPIAADFGVPGAKTVSEAVKMIQGNPDLANDSAVEMLAIQVDLQEVRMQRIEKKLGIKSAE